MAPQVLAADALEGDRVVNRAGEELGTIEEVMIDLERGTVAYVVVSCAGPGERLVAVPWTALTIESERRCFVLDADRARLDRAPAFERDRWPAMADERWAAQVHAFYGVAPYWDRRSGGPVPRQP